MVVNYAINEYILDRSRGFSTIASLTSAKNGPADVTAIAESNYNGIYQDWSDGFKDSGPSEQLRPLPFLLRQWGRQQYLSAAPRRAWDQRGLCGRGTLSSPRAAASWRQC